MGDASKVYRALTSIPWAITEDYLRLMVEVAARKEVDVAVVEERLGRKLENTRAVTERGGVAIIPITGPIFRYANLFSEISGGTSVQVLAKDFRSALDSPDVRAILLNIDSPGGDANGINEFAAMVFAARDKKPIHAYIGGMGCSAAYWIASASSSIICDATALVGSIGVIASMPAGDDPTEVTFISSQSPRKRASPATEEGRSDIQALIDAMADVFVGRVAEYRNTTVDTVLTSFGQGGVFVGQHAVDAGLADRLGSFEATLAGMSGGQAPVQSAQVTDAEVSAVVASTKKRQAAPVLSASLSFPSLSVAGPPPPVSHTRQTKEIKRMSEEETRAAPAIDAPDDMPLSLSEEDRQQVRATERARYQAQIEAIRAEARLEMQREIARFQRENTLTAWAQDATSPRLDRPKALPIEPQLLTSFVLALDGLSTDLSAQFQTIIGRILTNDLIDFSEHGSQGGADERDASELWNAALAAKKASGMTASAAIDALRKEQPDLYRAYNESGATRQKGGR
jgi:ClpP class serine protease